MKHTGNIAGNYSDKYNSKNPISRRLVENFLKTFDSFTHFEPIGSVYELGCGEGVLSWRLHRQGWKVTASDIDPGSIHKACADVDAGGHGGPIFEVRSIYDLEDDSLSIYDLVICCEVLEHLPNPVQALETLRRTGCKNLVCSVPREPLWRILNMARGKYMAAWGNTPGHLNHWSSKKFARLISTYFSIERIAQPIPWTFIRAIRQ